MDLQSGRIRYSYQGGKLMSILKNLPVLQTGKSKKTKDLVQKLLMKA